VSEHPKKRPELLALKENLLRIVGDVVTLSERIENLRKDIGVLGWKMKTLERSLIGSEPFSTSISHEKLINSLNRRLTTLENQTLKTANIANHLEASLLRRVLTAGNPLESEENGEIGPNR